MYSYQYYIVWEQLAERDLMNVYCNFSRYSMAKIKQLVGLTCRAFLLLTQDYQIYHRDWKLDNLILRQNSELNKDIVTVIDFGMSYYLPASFKNIESD